MSEQAQEKLPIALDLAALKVARDAILQQGWSRSNTYWAFHTAKAAITAYLEAAALDDRAEPEPLIGIADFYQEPTP